MTPLFYISAAVAVFSTLMVVTRLNAVHALLYLIVSLLSSALVFFILGAPFIAALEIIVYAGAIMVLFLFVIMMLNLGTDTAEREGSLFTPGIWIGPAILTVILLGELIYALSHGPSAPSAAGIVTPKQVGAALFGPYVLGVELASMLLLAGLVGAYHLGHNSKPEKPERRNS